MQLLWLFISTSLQVFCVLRSYSSVFRIFSYNTTFHFKRTCKTWSSCEIYIYLEQCCLFAWIQWHHCSTGSQGLISGAYTWKLVCKWDVELMVGGFYPFSPKQFGRTCVRATGHISLSSCYGTVGFCYIPVKCSLCGIFNREQIPCSCMFLKKNDMQMNKSCRLMLYHISASQAGGETSRIVSWGHKLAFLQNVILLGVVLNSLNSLGALSW